MQRSLVSLLSTALLALLLVSCGDKSGSSSDTSGKTTITFWTFQSEPGQKAALMARVKAFEEANPTVAVKVEDLTWNDGKAKLQSAFSAGQGPDVLELGSDWVAQFSSAEVLADLNAISPVDVNRFTGYAVDPGRWGGKLYALPWTIDTRVLFVNTALLAGAGQDTSGVDSLWSGVLAKAEHVSRPPDIYGFGAQGDDQHRLYKKIIPFFWSNGGDILDGSGKPVVNSPANVAALETYLALARAGRIDTQKGLDGDFLKGRIAYWISGPWLADRIARENPSLRYKTVSLPGFAGHAGVSFAGGEYLAINEKSAHRTEALRFIQFLTDPKQALEFAKALPGGTTPSDRSTMSDPFLQSGVRAAFTRQLEHAKMTPVHPKWLEIEAIIEHEVTAALLAEKDARTALDGAQAQIVALLAGDAGTDPEASIK